MAPIPWRHIPARVFVMRLFETADQEPEPVRVRLITASLLSRAQFYPQNIFSMLNRKYTPPNTAMQGGIDLEKSIVEKTIKGTPDALKELDFQKGTVMHQVKKSKYLKVGNEVYLINGVADAVFPVGQFVVDYKATTSPKSAKRRYQKSPQAPIYCFLFDVLECRFLITEYIRDPDGGQFIVGVERLVIRYESYDKVIEDIENRINDLMAFLQAEDTYWSTYQNVFCHPDYESRYMESL